MKYWGRGQGGGELLSWVFFVVVSLAEEGFVICAGSSRVADTTPWKHSAEGSTVGLDILPLAVTGNCLKQSHLHSSRFSPCHWCGALSCSSGLTRVGAAGTGCS